MADCMNTMNICEVLSRSKVAKTDIKKLIHRTYYTNRKENYGTICMHGNTASLENIGVGEAGYIPLIHASGCSGGSEKLAEIHTHPSRNLFMSDCDILDSFRRNMRTVCIGVESEFKEDRVRCYTLKDEYKNKSIYTDNLKKEMEQIMKEARIADEMIFKATYYDKDEKLRSKAYAKRNELKDKYWNKSRELENLMEDSLNWFDYCDLFL